MLQQISPRSHGQKGNFFEREEWAGYKELLWEVRWTGGRTGQLTRNRQCPFPVSSPFPEPSSFPVSSPFPTEVGSGEREATDVWLIQTQNLLGNLFGLVRDSVQLIIDMAKKEIWAGLWAYRKERVIDVFSKHTGTQFYAIRCFRERKNVGISWLCLFNRYSVSASFMILTYRHSFLIFYSSKN